MTPRLRAIVAPPTAESLGYVEIRIPSGRRIHAVAFAADARHVVAWSTPSRPGSVSDPVAHVWDATTGQELQAPEVPYRPPTASRDGTLQIERGATEGGWGSPVRVHDRRTGSVVAVLETEDEAHLGVVALSGDGARVAAGGYGLDSGLLVVWSVVSQERLAAVVTDEHVYAIAMSRNGRVVASGNSRGVIELWHAEGGRPIGAHRVHDASIDAMAFADDGRIVSASNEDGSMRVARLEGSSHDPSASPHPDAIVDVLFSVDGTRLVTRSENDTMWLWDTLSGKPVRCLHASSGRVLEGGTAQHAIFAGAQIVSLAHGGAVWDAKDGGAIVAPTDAKIFWSTRVGLSPDGRTVLLVPRSGGDAFLGPTLERNKGTRISDEIRCHAFSPEGDTVAWTDPHGTVVVQNARTGAIRQSFKPHKGEISALALSKDTCMTAGADDLQVGTWGLRPGGVVTDAGSFRVPERVAGLGFSPHGRVVTASQPTGPFSTVRTVRIWDTRKGVGVDTIEGIVDWRSLLVDRPWRAVIRDGDFVVESTLDRQPIASMHTPLRCFTTHPSRPMWAGAVGNQLHWFTLES